ncbi:MAG: hypothetical protein LBG94_07085 [Treponema sp.]|jgi:hypothetical protein|nr:hypothetical protein [Treponema sp.]
MDIKINDRALDVSLDNENTLGEVLAGLEQWLGNMGHRISSISIDGEQTSASMIESIFSREIDKIQCVDIQTNAIAELMAASLLNLLEDIREFEKIDFKDKQEFFNNWTGSATAQFISAEIFDLYAFCVNTFSNGNMTGETLISVTEEILREVNEPVKELTNLEPILKDTCERLENLPLDIQTGKDARAAQSIQIFSAVTEKIIRLYRQLNMQGYLSTDEQSEELLETQITNFSGVLKELLEAYEKNDSVLVGDLTEYEASPKLKDLFYAILGNVKDKDSG